MKTKIILLLLITASLFSNTALAQDGANDPTFNPGDTGWGNGTDGTIESVALQQDGKIIIGGNFNKYKGISRNYIARLNTNETLDTSFDPGEGANGIISTVNVLANGKIIIAGNFTEYDGISRNRIAILNSNGTIDESFNPGLGFDNSVEAVAVQSDNKIIIAGAFTTYNSVVAKNIIRLNTDGSTDASFLSQGNGGTVYDLAIQSDGKIIVGGSFTQFSGLPKGGITRLNANGSNDPTFFTGTGAESIITSLELQADGKIIVGGWFGTFNNESTNGVIRLNSNGSRDINFNFSGFAIVFDLELDNDQKILVVGSLSTTGSDQYENIARLNTNGTTDPEFITSGADFVVTSVAVKPDNNIVIGGRFLLYNDVTRNYIASINHDGSVNTFFDIGVPTGADHTIASANLTPDGKILIAGHFKHYNGIERTRIARLNENGILDEAFYPGSGADMPIEYTLIQNDAKIIIVGDFTTYDGHTAGKIARINSDGSFDTSFGAGVGFSPFTRISSVTLQNDGKILVAGDIYSYNNVAVNSMIVRINADGSLDTGFIMDEVLRTAVKMIVQPDNKIILGYGSSFSSSGPQYTVVRLNPDGTMDSGFIPLPATHAIFTSDMELQPDGKLLIACSLPVLPHINNKLTRLNTDGSFDAIFDAVEVVGDTGYLNKVKLLNDGKILLHGDFIEDNGVARKILVRLNSDWTNDESFNAGTGPDAYISSILIQPEGKVILAGYFFSYDGTGRNRIARIFSSESLGTSTPEIRIDKVIAYKNNDVLRIDSMTDDIKSVQVYDLAGKLIAAHTDIDVSSDEIGSLCTNSIYIVKVRLTDNTQVTKKIYY